MHGVKVLPVYGDSGYQPPIKALKAGVIIIGTWASLWIISGESTIRPHHKDNRGTDEADEMLNRALGRYRDST